MSINKFGEVVLACVQKDSCSYAICRDRAGMHVLRDGSPNGEELFSPVLDDGSKNKGKQRVVDVRLLYDAAEGKI